MDINTKYDIGENVYIAHTSNTCIAYHEVCKIEININRNIDKHITYILDGDKRFEESHLCSTKEEAKKKLLEHVNKL